MNMDYEILGRFLLAALWGGLVGAEREYRSKSAGFRTMIMISIGACFFTMMSVFIGGSSNPDRIASNIVTGIGFLGAGVIFKGDNRVNGITTAAAIWAVAAVGMGIGIGHYFASACASVLILIVLAVLPYLEKIIELLNQSKIYAIEYDFIEGKRVQYENLMKHYHLKFKLASETKEGNYVILNWQVQGRANNHQMFIDDMMKDDSIKKFGY